MLFIYCEMFIYPLQGPTEAYKGTFVRSLEKKVDPLI